MAPPDSSAEFALKTQSCINKAVSWVYIDEQFAKIAPPVFAWFSMNETLVKSSLLSIRFIAP